MITTTMIKRAAAGLLLLLVATGLSAKDSSSGKPAPDGSQYEKVKPEVPKYPEKPKVPVYSIPEPAGLALLSAGLGAVGLSMLLRRRKRR